MAENPDFQWARFYYPDILEALLLWKSGAWPEHTETDPNDPVVQLLRLFALVGHGAAVRLDHVARELYLPTLRLRPSMVALARLVDYRLAPPVPAQADIVADLSSAASAGTRLVRARSRFSNGGTPELPAVLFEYISDTDLLLTVDSGVYAFGSYLGSVSSPGNPQELLEVADHTADPVGAVLFDGVAGDLVGANRQGLLWWHPDLMFDRISVTLPTPSAHVLEVRWEYYDDSRILQPDLVLDLGGTIGLVVNTLVGRVQASQGLDVLVTCLRTGQQEWLQTTSGGGESVSTTGTLGQTTVSTNPADYLVQTFWPELPDLEDGTNDLAAAGEVLFTLPQGPSRRWAKFTPIDADGDTLPTGFYVRARITAVSGINPPVFDEASQPPGTTWSVMVPVLQGRQHIERVGTTDAGSAGQTFELPRAPLLSLDSVTLSDGPWGRVENFLSSNAFDRHFTLDEQPDGTQLLTFGNGVSGKIPPASSPVTVAYRVGGELPGNLGPGAITRDRSGNSKLKGVRNPRAATGWVEQEGTTEASLDRTRVAVPASLRAGGRAVTPADIEALAIAFRTASGAQLAERALAIQEGNGPKTVALVVAAPGGLAPTQAELAELDTYFNGRLVGLQRLGGVLLTNMELAAESFTPRVIAVTATVSVLADFAAGAQQRIEAALGAKLRPGAKRLVLDSNGLWVESEEFQWRFGGTVSRAFLFTVISTAIPGVVNVALAVPAADVALADRELPVPGAFAITVVSI